MSADDVQLADYTRRAKRAAAIIVADADLPSHSLPYDVLVNLIALGWVEGRIAAKNDIALALGVVES